MCLCNSLLQVCHFHHDKTITETLTLFPNILNTLKATILTSVLLIYILHLLTKFLKAQQSSPIQVFGLKII